MNKEVSYPLSRLLKEKEFNEPCKWYMKDGVTLSNSNETNDFLMPDYYSAPTISDVVMWIYEKHGIWIYIHQSTARLGFKVFIQRLSILGESDIQNDEKYEEPHEAYEAAITYILEKLI